MSEHRIVTENRQFGRYLRRIREDRRLSLDAVEEMTVGYPEPVTKSHLSRIENGRAVPSFPRMFALSQVYGVPISSIAERFETDLRDKTTPPDLIDGQDPESLRAGLEALQREGRYDRILQLTTAALGDEEDAPEEQATTFRHELQLWHVGALMKLERYESCKLRCEALLCEIPENTDLHRRVLITFVLCSYRLRRFAVALMGLEHISSSMREGTWPQEMMALVAGTRGAVSFVLGDYSAARAAFEESLTLYERMGNDLERCRAHINLAQVAISLRQLREANRHLDATVAEAERRRFERQLAIAWSHRANVRFMENSHDAAERYAIKSNTLARKLGHSPTLFRNCFYLREIALERNDRTTVVAQERSLKVLLHRVPTDMPEAERYRRILEGGAGS